MSIQPQRSKIYLWDKRTLYLGPLPDPISLTQGASTLLVSLGGDIRFQTASMETPICCNSLLIPPGSNISIDTGSDDIANCNLDALCEDFYYLSKVMTPVESNIFINVDDVHLFRDVYRSLLSEPFCSSTAYEQLDQLFIKSRESIYDKNKMFSSDPRIAKVIELIKKKIDDNTSVEELARSVDLSEPRLMQLFKETTGVPIRRYRLWHRLYTTSIKLADGYSLTDAALLAGFTDSAHFSKTFKDMLGMSPTRILGQPNGIEIITPIHT